jgi:hypothetical protein
VAGRLERRARREQFLHGHLHLKLGQRHADTAVDTPA